MKNTKERPKCHSKEILRIPGQAKGYGSVNVIFTGITAVGAVEIIRFLCTECGFMEEWIENRKDIEKLKTTFDYA